MGVLGKKTTKSDPNQGYSHDRDRDIPSEGSGLWEDAPYDFTRRCVCMEVYGDTDTGRSTLALTAPGPIAYIHTLEKIDGLFQIFAKQGKTIRPCTIPSGFKGSPELVQKTASAAVDKLESAMSDAYSWARTIILDTHTEAWQIYQLARLGSLTRDGRSDRDNKMGQLVYTEINNRWNSMLKEYRVRTVDGGKNVNLIIIGQTSAEYKKNPATGQTNATGKTIRSGQKQVGFFCDVIVRTRREMKGGNDVYTGTIEKPWWNGGMRGLEVTDDMLTFPEIMGVLTETDAGEWS